jgi:Xaa-Pro aminopeptidase
VIVKSPIDLAEAIKNPVEIEGFKRAYLRDGVAFVKWQAWLEEKMKSGANISEWDAAEKLTQYRSTGENFAGVRLFAFL